jgi:hypothetical protein
MQKEEAIIKQFAKVIREAQPQVEENPVLLGKIFAAMEAKRKKRRFIWILFFSLITGGGLMGVYGLYNKQHQVQHNTVLHAFTFTRVSLGLGKHVYTAALEQNREKQLQPTEGGIKKSTQVGTHHASIKPNKKNAVKVPPLKVWEFNIYGEDGSEQDALQVIRELKETKGKRKPQEE